MIPSCWLSQRGGFSFSDYFSDPQIIARSDLPRKEPEPKDQGPGGTKIQPRVSVSAVRELGRPKIRGLVGPKSSPKLFAACLIFFREILLRRDPLVRYFA